jgi:myo-inositol-1(or 4)-monophosphatase
LDEIICAADGEGAWWNGRRAHVSTQDSFKRACVCYTSVHSFEPNHRTAAWERIQKAAYMVRGWSDAYGYLLVATGRAEAMLDPAMSIWDCAPFPPILREAGGYFGSWDGKPGHTHNEAIATTSTLLPELLRLIEG